MTRRRGEHSRCRRAGQIWFAVSDLQWPPSPLEAEGWGGGYLSDSAARVPPSRLARIAREPTSPSRGEVIGASGQARDIVKRCGGPIRFGTSRLTTLPLRGREKKA
jgi:hypothetical protein